MAAIQTQVTRQDGSYAIKKSSQVRSHLYGNQCGDENGRRDIPSIKYLGMFFYLYYAQKILWNHDFQLSEKP